MTEDRFQVTGSRRTIAACTANEPRASNGSPDFRGLFPHYRIICNADINKNARPSVSRWTPGLAVNLRFGLFIYGCMANDRAILDMPRQTRASVGSPTFIGCASVNRRFLKPVAGHEFEAGTFAGI